MKRKILYLSVCILAFALYGCGKEDKETNFIPTPAPTQAPEDLGEKEEVREEETEATEEEEEAYVGKTTTKYVKLKNPGSIINVRTQPSTDSEIVGFMVHSEAVEVINIENGWASFVYNGEIRYVSADYLSDTKPDIPSTPAPTLAPAKAPDNSEEPADI